MYKSFIPCLPAASKRKRRHRNLRSRQGRERRNVPDSFTVRGYDENVGEGVNQETWSSSKNRLLRRISGRILGLDFVESASSSAGISADEPCYANVVSYLLQHVRENTRANIAKYLASSNLNYCKIDMENIHNYYHVASCLHLEQLLDHCLNFCSLHNQTEVLSRFEGCHCYKEVRRHSISGYQQNATTVVSNPDETEILHYYIMFSENSGKIRSKKRKTAVIVVDISNKLTVYYKEENKLHLFGEGFACCAIQIRESPYVFVSGGKGKSSQMMVYDVVLARWSNCSKMLHGRAHHMMVSVGENSIVVLGGHGTACIEEYYIRQDTWRERLALLVNVKSSAVLALEDKIYIFGGETPSGAVATIQCYDVRSRDIECLSNLPCEISGGRCVLLKSKIYIASEEGHMIHFDPFTGNSSLCLEQPVCRRQFGMFVRQDRIYIVGGDVKSKPETHEKTSQYRYNVTTDTWEETCRQGKTFPVLASCLITYPQKCSVVPFNDLF